nr:lipopolysaccharide biosynthesis protein [Rhodococcus sp. HNM0563]
MASVAARGASFTIAGQLIRVVTMLLGTVVLARLLAPEAFGLVAVVLSLVAFGELVRDFGLSTAAARAEKLTRGQQSNLFWINTAIGVVLTVIAYACGPFVADVFGQEELSEIVRWTAPLFIANGLATQFRAEINRKLNFKGLAVVDTLPPILGLVSAVGFIFAFSQANYWALVAQQLATSMFGLLLAVPLAGWIPGLPSRRASVRNLLSFSAGLFGTQSVAYLARNIDNLAISYFWGPASLGIYSRAYQLLMAPINQISAPLTRVTVPILTRVADQRGRFMSYLEAGQLVGGIGIGLLYGVLFGLAEPVVLLVFGEPWAPIIPVFQGLAVGGVFRALNQVTFWVFLAKGATGSQFKFYLVSQPLIVACMIAGIPWGALGVAVGHSVGYALNWTISFWWCGRVTDTPMAALYWAGVKSIFAFSVPIAAIGLAASWLVPGHLACIGVGAVAICVYLGLLWCISDYAKGVAAHTIYVLRKVRTRGAV